MSEFKFACPHCEQHLQCDEQFSGRQIQCPRCHHLIRVPAVPGKTAQFDPQSGMTWATHVPGAGAGKQPGPLPGEKKPPANPDKE
jgi:hypothetical protein